MKRPKLSLGDLLAGRSATKDPASSNSPIPATNETEEQVQKQLADAREEARNALAEWLRYPTPYYEKAWTEAIEKVQRLEARIPKRKAMFGG